MAPQTEQVIIALGANLDSPHGSPVQTLPVVVERLRGLSPSTFSASSLFLTQAQDCPPGTPDFVNGVVRLELDANINAEDLLRELQGLEAEFGRHRSGRQNEARPLDLDLISFGSRQQASADLILPHPRAHLRRFVLQPLQEIAPDLILPGQSKTITQLLQDVSATPPCTRIDQI